MRTAGTPSLLNVLVCDRRDGVPAVRLETTTESESPALPFLQQKLRVQRGVVREIFPRRSAQYVAAERL